uniref:BZIP domain-containing protein n=1 Tax=Chaetoceros debilis TaxID=122233 RepID=A0A7S3V8R0_9STRA|mmetsp:Transcript_7828/g.11641  ORF Transcript_7828/g.11641 Transcript_7828/m.11641 type:complete len:364 (-) Transcript_7828:228-1319(-)|eukprot:CAMPEP_0194087188 /NCGR_PEP_ID=MMETSP0149-20130528/23933_1 /TAXON_ID=122233 /ORGANISM="Chaetoceros debilis, Strain MM31A-1" /LENGTH=363 /DNA_ID=CAMNT_0038770461 /DNA_START=104 /DNA_END=1195 /DNA_ORIENTATION=+
MYKKKKARVTLSSAEALNSSEGREFPVSTSQKCQEETTASVEGESSEIDSMSDKIAEKDEVSDTINQQGASPLNHYAFSTNNTKDGTGIRTEREERRMEANRQRARDIRKRKKKMVEEMKQQIVQLTLENRQLVRQNQMQQAELQTLRNAQQATSHHQGLLIQQQQQQQQQRQFSSHLMQHPTMLQAPFLPTMAEARNAQSNMPLPMSSRGPARNSTSGMVLPPSHSNVLSQATSSRQPHHTMETNSNLMNASHQAFLSDNQATVPMLGMPMSRANAALHSNLPAGGAGKVGHIGANSSSNREFDMAGQGRRSFPHTSDALLNQLLQQQQQGGMRPGDMRIQRNISEFKDFPQEGLDGNDSIK